MNENPEKKRRWMPILLTASLALNLLVVGLVIGTALRFRDGNRGRIPPGFASALFRALPDSDRKVLRGEMADRHSRGTDRRADDFNLIGQALRAVPFDPTEVKVLLDRQAQSNVKLQRDLHDAWLARITAMSNEERASYVNRLEEVVKKGPRRKKR
ncbi:MAG: periplasmic heavy metal sensor [Ruegeria sp.]